VNKKIWKQDQINVLTKQQRSFSFFLRAAKLPSPDEENNEKPSTHMQQDNISIGKRGNPPFFSCFLPRVHIMKTPEKNKNLENKLVTEIK